MCLKAADTETLELAETGQLENFAIELLNLFHSFSEVSSEDVELNEVNRTFI